MEISNKTVLFNFNDKLITRRVANTHARTSHQPIYVQKDRTDTDIYICTQDYYIQNNIANITGLSCPKNEKKYIEDFVIKKETFNAYVKNLKTTFEDYGLNEFYKGDLDDIFLILDDLRTTLVLMHTTQQKVRLGFGNEQIKKIILDALIGDLTQITFDFLNKEISLNIPRENLLYLLEEVGKFPLILNDPKENKYGIKNKINKGVLIHEAETLQMCHEELIEKYGADGTVVHDMLKTRSSSLQNYFRKLLIDKHKKCLLCDISDKRILIASHIKPASASNALEKGDINNGLLLCPLHDKLFDRGYITFDSNSGELILDKSILDEKILYKLDTTKNYNQVKTDEMKVYMIYHNKNVFVGDI
jgi:hypothetical protein